MVAAEATRTLEEKCLKEVKRPILTAIDEPIVVSLVCFCAITALLEVHRGDTLGTTGGVIMKSNVTKGADGGVE